MHPLSAQRVAPPQAEPCVQEYTEEFRDIAPRAKKNNNIPDGNITLINQRSVCDDLPVRSIIIITGGGRGVINF